MRRTEGSELATTSDLALATFLVLKDLDPEVETDPKTRTVNFGFPPDTRYRDLVPSWILSVPSAGLEGLLWTINTGIQGQEGDPCTVAISSSGGN